jgi:hypothetical protein
MSDRIAAGGTATGSWRRPVRPGPGEILLTEPGRA